MVKGVEDPNGVNAYIIQAEAIRQQRDGAMTSAARLRPKLLATTQGRCARAVSSAF